MLPANEARQFTNKDTVMYLEPGTNSTALGHEIWRLWYPLRRRDAFGKESNLLERYVVSTLVFFLFSTFCPLFTTFSNGYHE